MKNHIIYNPIQESNSHVPYHTNLNKTFSFLNFLFKNLLSQQLDKNQKVYSFRKANNKIKLNKS